MHSVASSATRSTSSSPTRPRSRCSWAWTTSAMRPRPSVRSVSSPPAVPPGSLGGGMLDHVFLDFIAATHKSFSEALLQRQAVEERFQVDVLLGDLSWETSYSLPGESSPPRVRADLSIDWPTW